MRRTRRVLLAAVLVLLTAVIVAALRSRLRDVPDSDDVHALASEDRDVLLAAESLLITQTNFLDGSGALLLEDAGRVRAIGGLLADTGWEAHQCGHHWRLTFVTSDRRTTDLWFNWHCERFTRHTSAIQRTLQPMFLRTWLRPTHHVLDLIIEPATTPEELVVALETDGRRVFFFEDPVSRLPHVRLSWQFDGGREAPTASDHDLVTAALADVDPRPVMIAEPHKRVYSANTRSFENRVYFPIGTDLDLVHARLASPALVAVERGVPRFGAQLVVDHEMAPNELADLVQRHPFIQHAFEHSAELIGPP